MTSMQASDSDAGWIAAPRTPPIPPLMGPPEEPPGYSYQPPSPPSLPPPPPAPPEAGHGSSPTRRRSSRIVGAAVALALAAGGAGFGLSRAVDDSSPTTPATTAVQQSTGSSTLAASGLDIHALIARVAPSVVDIEIGQQVRNSVRDLAAGSGVVISTDGLILTNAHVVDLTDQFGRTISNAVITVKTADGHSRTATVLGVSTANDIALIQVQDTSGLTPATLGDSDALQVGDDVVAIGNALDLGDTPTVTKGIVSAKDRTLEVDANTTLKGLIQTDAAINHGNSGGALVNSAGAVVGINSAAIPDAQNVGFAIAINTIKPLIDQLKSGKAPAAASKAVLGVTLQETVAGVVITGVSSGSGAANAGLRVGDRITKINGKDIATTTDVGSVISSLQPGASVTIEFARGTSTQTVTATLGG